jgi:hypothetical protein
MSNCRGIRAQFSEYLDGSLTGVAMQKIAAHLEVCPACAGEFSSWREMQTTLSNLGPARPPAELALRLRVALSQEHAKTPRRSLARWQMRWENSLAPFLLKASAGLASAVLLVGTVALLVGTFATPETLQAHDEPLGEVSGPHFLYSSAQTDSRAIGHAAMPIVVEAYVNGDGRVYDYRIVSGADNAETRTQIENMLLFSKFDPARSFGQPVRGLAVLSFAGVSVQG